MCLGPAGRWANAEEGRREGPRAEKLDVALHSFALVASLWDLELEPSSCCLRGRIGPSGFSPLEGASPRQCSLELQGGGLKDRWRVGVSGGPQYGNTVVPGRAVSRPLDPPPPFRCSDVAAASLGFSRTSSDPTTGHVSPEVGTPARALRPWAAVVNIRRAPRVGPSVCRVGSACPGAWECLRPRLLPTG